MGFGIKAADVAAIKAKTDNLPTDPASGSAVASAISTAHATTNGLVVTVDGVVDDIKAKTDNLPADPASESGAIKTETAAIKAKTDNLPTDPAGQSEVEAEIQKAVTWMDFWSDHVDVIDLPATINGGTDKDLPNVVVSGLPSGISLVRVVAMLKVRAIENTSGTGANAIAGAQAIRVKKSAGTWGVDDLAAIDLPDNLWTVAASTRESGDVLIGDNDVKDEVDGDATYNLRFEDAIVDYDNLRLNDVMVGLRFYFTTG